MSPFKEYLTYWTLSLTILSFPQIISSVPVLTGCQPCPSGFRNDGHCETGSVACLPCESGTYADHTGVRGHCYPCSACGPGLFELHPCNLTSDVFCELCSWIKAKDNVDYQKKCVKYPDSRWTYLGTLEEKTAHPVRHHRKKNNKIRHKKPKLDLEGVMLGDQPAYFEPNSEFDIDHNVKDNPVSVDEDVNIEKNKRSPHSYTSDVEDVQSERNVQGFLEDEASPEEDKLIPQHAMPSLNLILESAHNPEQSIEEAGEVSKFDSSGYSPVYSGTEEIPDYSGEEKVLITSTVFPTKEKDFPDDIGEVTDKVDIKTYFSEYDKLRSTFEPIRPDSQAVVTVTGHLPVWVYVLTVLMVAVVFVIIGFLVDQCFLKEKRSILFCKGKKKSYSPVKTRNQHHDIDFGATGGNGQTFKNADTMESLLGDETTPPKEKVTSFTEYKSPINIEPEAIDVDERLEKNELVISPGYMTDWVVINIGSTIKIKPAKDTEHDVLSATIKGGPLGQTAFRLDHIHLHWGSSDDRGSEHTVRGRHFPAEIHLVYWNSDVYQTFIEASQAEDGLCVFSSLIDVDPEENESLKAVIDSLSCVEYKGESRDLQAHHLELLAFLPRALTEYWTYPGSESEEGSSSAHMVWVVFKETIKLSSKQLAALRTLKNHERSEGHALAGSNEGYIVDNFRQVSPTADRLIRASFL